MKENNKRYLLFTILTGLLLVFIWGNSCIPRSGSAAESGFVLRLLQPFLGRFLSAEAEVTVTDHMVRKLAHFVEYGALGVCLLHRAFFGTHAPETLRDYAVLLRTGFGIAFIDESIQILSQRGAQIQDVWLDGCGVLAGLLLVAAGHGIKLLLRNNREAN